MAFNQSQCAAFNSYLGTRPYNWDKRIAKDRKPSDSMYVGMYKTEEWKSFTNTTHLHERVYVTRPNDPSLWNQFVADPCVGAPCNIPRQYIGHGVDQLRYDMYAREYQTPVFCLDQLNTVEEAIEKMGAIAEGYKELPEIILSDFIRLLSIRKCGSAALGGGLYLCGVQDQYGNPVELDVSDNMFFVSEGQSKVNSTNTLLVNLNANGGLTALAAAGTITGATTAGLQGAMGQLTMEYLANCQEDLAANGYHDKDWLIAGKFSITTDATTRRRLMNANPALTQMYSAADFAKGGAFYSFGITNGCGDWLFKEDKCQMRFRFRGDLDGLDFNGNALSGAVWIEQVQPYINVNATYGLKPQFSPEWKNAPIRLYHAYNRETRTVKVPDITSVNSEMKFGMARSFMGDWHWYSPDFFNAVDPSSGQTCSYQNDKKNMGYWVAEFRLGIKTVYPEIERMILALGEAQPYLRVPRTNTPPSAPISTTDYQNVLAYNAPCTDYTPPGFQFPQED